MVKLNRNLEVKGQRKQKCRIQTHVSVLAGMLLRLMLPALMLPILVKLSRLNWVNAT